MFECPDIDYKIWCQRNVYYGDNPIDPAGLTNAKKGGLITRDFSSIDELLNLLATKIENYTFDNDNEDELLIIFDLIQAWGGRQNRKPYHSTAERITDPQTFYQKYKANIEYLCAKDWEKYFSKLNVDHLEKQKPKIPDVGLNFLSKHYYFWSTYKKISRVFYIYDSRNIALFESKNKKKLSYFEYLDAIENKAQEFGISGTDVEKGIFAFSKNYFDIKFNLKNSMEYKEDISEARSLSSKSNI
jgi:hypothetical protein